MEPAMAASIQSLLGAIIIGSPAFPTSHPGLFRQVALR